MSGDSVANYLLKKLNNLSGFEVISITFFISIGISLIYKYGYYSTLGIDWYINILTPQYLFMSSFMLLTFIFLGMLTGAVLGLKYRNFTRSILGQAIFVLMLSGLFFAYMLGIEIDFKFTVSFLSAIMVFTFIDAYLITPIQDNGSELYNFINIIRLLSIGLPLCFILFSPYFYGKREAEILLSGKHNLNMVSLGDEREKWLLLEMNGEKALLVSKSNFKKFKLIEYKEIREFHVP